jgi:PLP dependent protein
VFGMSLGEIRTRMAAAAERAGREASSIQLLAVSKVQPEDRVRAVLAAGHRVFGENRVQEAEDRWTPLRAEYPDVELHLIGPLQSNKVRRAMEFFHAIHSIDRERLVRRIADAVQASGRCPLLFAQVNTGREPQKAGVTPENLDALIESCRGHGLSLHGLMCIPPAEEDPAPHFTLLRELAERHGLTGLSMGMSGDFEQAIAAGATHVRVGSAIFGERQTPQR